MPKSVKIIHHLRRRNEKARTDIFRDHQGPLFIRRINLGDLEKKAGIPHTTMWKRMKDGEWTRGQIKQMHRFLHFTEADMKVFVEGR